MTSLSVPIVDLSPFTSSGDSNSRAQAAQDLSQKVRINGCVGIIGHGISPDMLAEAFQVNKKLFDLPYEEKMKAPHPDSAVPHRGYSGTGREKNTAKTALETDDEGKKEAYLEEASDYKACFSNLQNIFVIIFSI